MVRFLGQSRRTTIHCSTTTSIHFNLLSSNVMHFFLKKTKTRFSDSLRQGLRGDMAELYVEYQRTPYFDRHSGMSLEVKTCVVGGARHWEMQAAKTFENTVFFPSLDCGRKERLCHCKRLSPHFSSPELSRPVPVFQSTGQG